MKLIIATLVMCALTASTFAQTVTLSVPAHPREDNPTVPGRVIFHSNQAVAEDLWVNFSLVSSANSATEGVDYQPLPNPRKIKIPQGLNDATLQIWVIDDTEPEVPESILIKLEAGPGYTIGTTFPVNAGIYDNDPVTVSVIASDPTAAESGGDNGEFRISRNGPISSALTVYFSVPTAGQMAWDLDITPFASGSVTIKSGASSTNLAVLPVNDTLKEWAEDFTLTLQPGSGYVVSQTQGSATVTINDDDGNPPGLDQWEAVYYPFQLHRLDFTVDVYDWNDLVAGDLEAVSAWMEGEDENPILVELREKHGSLMTPQPKLALKVDINALVPEQSWRGLQKLSLEPGGTGFGPVKEGFCWYLYRLLAGKKWTGLCSWTTVYVNGVYQGVYANVEQPNKELLDHRGLFREESVWLYKDTELITSNHPDNSTPFPMTTFYGEDPPACYPGGPRGCGVAEVADIENLLTIVLIDLLTDNNDGITEGTPTHIGSHNMYRADFYPLAWKKSLHFPWDLDATPFDIGNAQVLPFQWAIDNPYLMQRQTEILREWLQQGPLTEANINDFLARLEFMLKDALATDPNPYLVNKFFQPESISQHFSNLRTWFYYRRLHILSNLPAAPAAGPQISRSGDRITITPSVSGADVWYTTDGSDPWTVSNTLSVAARYYQAPFDLEGSTHIVARHFLNNTWSSATRTTLSLAGSLAALRISEIMYHPSNTNEDEQAHHFDNDDDFEFLELQNFGGVPLDLSLCRFSHGLTNYTFPAGTIIPARGFHVLVRNPKGFERRYPGRPYQGVYWTGKLDNGGERLTIAQADGTDFLDHTYDDNIDSTDGDGRSIVMPPMCAGPPSIRESPDVNGSPGGDEDVFPLRLRAKGMTLSGGNVGFNIQIEDYQLHSWDLQYSTDLLTWNNLMFSFNGQVTNCFTDWGAPEDAYRYYRVVYNNFVTPPSGRAHESENVICYIRKSLPAGYSLLSCPLIHPNGNVASNIFYGLYGDLEIQKYNNGYYVNNYIPDYGWIDPYMTLNPGEGFWVSVTQPTDIYFIGTMPEGYLFNQLPPGVTLNGSMWPRPYRVGWTGLNPVNGMKVYHWTGSDYDIFTYDSGVGWIPSEPILAVGEGVFVEVPSTHYWNLIYNRCD